MKQYTIGIDEVGRGSLAGPIVVAAALLKNSRALRTYGKLGRLKDSKKLSRNGARRGSHMFKGIRRSNMPLLASIRAGLKG